MGRMIGKGPVRIHHTDPMTRWTVPNYDFISMNTLIS